MFKPSKRTVAVTTATFMIAGGGVAFAYWTTTGTGSGTATNASTNGTLSLSAEFPGGLYPGGSVPVTFKASNAGASDLYFTGFSEAPVITTDNAGCLPADFNLSGLSTTAQSIVAGASAVTVGSATLNFQNSADNQDACKGAKVTISISSN